jgi:hypothetical protein
MVRLVQVTVPSIMREEVLGVLSAHPEVHHLDDFPSSNNVLFMFKMDSKHVSDVTKKLGAIKVGTEIGTVDIAVLSSTKPRLGGGGHTGKKKRKYAITDRMTVQYTACISTH